MLTVVYEVHKSFVYCGERRHTGGHAGTLYASLKSAQASIPAVTWTQPVGSRTRWASPRLDMIIKRAVKP
jgi:hypothetical protein